MMTKAWISTWCVLVLCVGMYFPGAHAASADEASLITVHQTNERFPVYFVPYRSELAVDGDLDEWQSQPPERVDELRFVPHARYAWGGPENHSAKFWMGWNEEGLHFATKVTDNMLRFDHIDAVDFKNADHVRMYLDLGRESQRTGASFDENDYIFAAIPDSPGGIPMMRQVSWDFSEDLPLLRPPEDFPLAGSTNETSWSLEVTFPPDAFPTWAPEINQALVMGICWGDTDTTIRENELFWPSEVRGPDTYWKDFRLYADLVLMSPDEGGFTMRATRPKVFKGQPWTFIVAARLAQPHPDPQRYRLRIRAFDGDGHVVQEWATPLLLEAQHAFHRVELLPHPELKTGAYTLRATLESGQVVLAGDDWPVELMAGAVEESREVYQQRMEQLRQYRNGLHRDITRRAGAGQPVDYDRGVRGMIDLFLPMAQRAFRESNYLETDRLLTNMERAVEEAKADPRPFAVTGAYRAQGAPVRINGSALEHLGERLFLIGFTSEHTFFPALVSDLGFNAFHSVISLRRAMPERGSPVPDDYVAEIREMYRAKQDHGIFGAVVGITVGTPAPSWMSDDPDISRAGGHFIPYCIEEPKSTAVLEIYYRGILKVLNGIDNAVLYLTLNEPEYEGRTPEFEQRFQAWLDTRYGDIAALNTEWGTTYARFAEVPADKLAAEPRARYDWGVFNQEHFEEHVQQLQDWVQQYDPRRRPTHVKLMSQPLRTPGAWASGIDWQRLSAITDMVGWDSPHADEPMMTDFMRSIAPGKPLVNSETHFEWYPHATPWLYQWRMAARGVDIMLAWQWRNPQRLHNRTGYPTQEPYGVWRTGRDALDIQRAAKPLWALSETPAQVAILHTQAALTFDTVTFFPRMREAYEALQYLGAPVRFITHHQLAAGELTPDIRFVVVPGIQHMTAPTRAALDAYVREGGLVLAVDSPMDRDVSGRPVQTEWSVPDRVVAIDASAPDWADRVERHRALTAVADREGVSRPIRVERSHGGPLFGVDAWVSADGRWLFVAPVEADGETVSVRFAGDAVPSQPGFDVVREQPFPFDGVVTLNRYQTYVVDLQHAQRTDLLE